jgi:hypothetical protein
MKRAIVFGLATLLTVHWLLRIPRLAVAFWQFGFGGVTAEATDFATHFLSFVRVSPAGVILANAFVLILTGWVAKAMVGYMRKGRDLRFGREG